MKKRFTEEQVNGANFNNHTKIYILVFPPPINAFNEFLQFFSARAREVCIACKNLSCGISV
jgi:hypothetical protein